MFGAVLLKGYSDMVKGELPSGWVGPFVVGTLASAGSGLLAISWLLGYVRGHNYTVFVVYRLVVAVLILLLIVSGVREATFSRCASPWATSSCTSTSAGRGGL